MDVPAPGRRRSGGSRPPLSRARILPGVPDRQAAVRWVTGALEDSEGRGHRFAALIADVDRLSSINHRFGSDIGNEVLRDVAAGLRAMARPTDFVARLGDNAFLLVRDHGGDPREVEALARLMLRRLSGARSLGTATVHVSVSIGIAFSHDAESSADRLIADAETATRRAKALGGARYAVLDGADAAAQSADSATSADLSRANPLSEFVAYFQPIVRLGDGTLAGYEALVRWRHPSRGLLGPDDFIHVAEESGAINDIGRSMLLRAAQLLAAARRADPHADVHVGVNVSIRQLLDPVFVKRVAKTIRLWRLRPGALVIELTESTVITDIDRVSASVRELREAGAAIAIDDFGIGYSSMMRVGSLPVDYLKVDRSFVAQMLQDPVQHRLVQTTVDLAHALGAVAIAEGVESDAVAEELRGLGCEQGQGYLWGRPMAADDALSWQSARSDGVAIAGAGD